MIITNNFDLPSPLVNAIKNDPYNKAGDVSATGIINPIRQTILKQRYGSELTEDASDRLWALIGSNFHHVLELANVDGEAELSVMAKIAGLNVSGTMDLLENRTIYDYKFTTVYATKDNEPKPEWVKQLNIYKFLAGHCGHVVSQIQVVCIYRDWSKLKAKVSKPGDYPPSQVQVFALPIWDKDKIEDYLYGRVHLLQSSQDLADDDLPLCSFEETWERPTVYAVKKNKNKKATKLFDNEEAAQKMADDKTNDKDKYSVEVRFGTRPRCESYCSVSEHCNQYKEWREAA